jgi:hypothetical protein
VRFRGFLGLGSLVVLLVLRFPLATLDTFAAGFSSSLLPAGDDVEDGSIQGAGARGGATDCMSDSNACADAGELGAEASGSAENDVGARSMSRGREGGQIGTGKLALYGFLETLTNTK